MTNIYASDVSPLVLDIETAPLLNACDFLDPPDLSDVQAPANYKDEKKIAAYIEEAKVKALENFERACSDKAALDWNLARVVALGYWTERNGLETALCRDEQEERAAITHLWDLAKHRMIVGFRVREFDIPMLVQRSRFLGIPHPLPDLGRFARGNSIADLFDMLTFNGIRGEQLMRQSARAFARRFGIAVDDAITGSEIPSLVAAGDWESVRAHVMSDVALTLALARRLRIINVDEQIAVA